MRRFFLKTSLTLVGLMFCLLAFPQHSERIIGVVSDTFTKTNTFTRPNLPPYQNGVRVIQVGLLITETEFPNTSHHEVYTILLERARREFPNMVIDLRDVQFSVISSEAPPRVLEGGFWVYRANRTFSATARVVELLPQAPPQITHVVQESVNIVPQNVPNIASPESTIIRWWIDSDPRGARIAWRVISSIPDIVRNTNDTHLAITPFEETRGFDIQGLTLENAHNVQIEIRVERRGYHTQTRRFNVRSAIDQREISTFFELVPTH